MFSYDAVDQLSGKVLDAISSGKELAPEFAILALSVDDAKKITEAIFQSAKLQSLTVNVNEQGYEGLVYMLSELLKIDHPIALDLNGVKINDQHIQCLSALLSANKLSGLDLQGCVVSWERFKPVFDQLPSAQDLKRLNISGCALGDEGYQYLVTCMKRGMDLETLMLYNTKMTDEGASLLGKTLSICNSLHTLNIGGNKITRRGIKEILRPFETRSEPVSYINCSHMSLSDEACTSFSLLIKLGKVKRLNLEGNWFSITSLLRLKNAVAVDHQLVQLKVKGNKFFTDHKGPNDPDLNRYPKVKEYMKAIEEKTSQNKTRVFTGFLI